MSSIVETVNLSGKDLEEDDPLVPESYEIERGKPMPSRNHAIVQANLCGEFLKQRKFRPMSEFSIRLDGVKYVPDICVYERQPVSFLHDVIEEQLPPLAALEIYSPYQGYNTVMEKVSAYLAAGVKTCWVVDPFQRTITIMPAEGESRSFVYGQIATDPATGLTADLNEVFS